MLWEVEILPAVTETDHEGQRVLDDAKSLGIQGLTAVGSARSFLVQGDIDQSQIAETASGLLCDRVVEQMKIIPLPNASADHGSDCINVLLHPGVTDSIARNAADALTRRSLNVTAVATCRKYRLTGELSEGDRSQLVSRVLANDAIEYVLEGPLQLTDLSVGSRYEFQKVCIAVRDMDDSALERLSDEGQLYLSLVEMQTIQEYFRSLGRDPTDIELETLAQTWSEHCSHKTLGGRIHYREHSEGEILREVRFDNMLQETIFRATQQIRERLGESDWCVSVFRDNAGVVKFDDQQSVCFKVETHNHPSAIEPYGGANTGLGGVIRDPMGTGLGARPVCSTDVFCFARPDFPVDQLPPGILHPRAVMQGVIAGVRDYGNRMGIPTVNGAVYFDDRYLGNPLVYCGNVAMIPNGKCEGHMQPNDLIVAVGGRTGRDGIHGATFSSAELTEDSESISGGSVQIGNPVVEKMVLDVLLQARDRDLYTAITDCGAGGFSSAVGEMGEATGAEVWLDRCPLKYSGLSYTEIWISEAQERMVLAVPECHRDEFLQLCESEGVECTVIGRFTDTQELVLKFGQQEVGRLGMSFLHDGRPPVIRNAEFEIPSEMPCPLPRRKRWDEDLKAILSSMNVASKEWIIRQYDHEVQAGSVVKPLVGAANDGPSDAAVVRPDLASSRGLVISCGMNPHFGDLDPWWMAAAAIDEAVRNCVAVGADPDRIAILDNFCWGNTERAETLGTLVRAAMACHEVSVVLGTPFISGKDSLNNEFSWDDDRGERQTVAIPSTLLISALGQVDDVQQCVTMDLKEAGNRLYLVGETHDELGGSHLSLVNGLSGGFVPRMYPEQALSIFRAVHQAIHSGVVRSCHDLSEGGLAVSAAEMAFAGGLGARLSLSGIASHLEDAVTLFSESNSRFLMEVPICHASEFESHLSGIPFSSIGDVTNTDRLVIENESGVPLIDSTLAALKRAWQSPFGQM
ncbi:MAG: phosphoribosylformylglycinamidine synthase subunit PurL [Fuerstiella sp.]|nr:phosphoribosylformylglycinamidine synthase subunit PurL [Fuerstiella sp.]